MLFYSLIFLRLNGHFQRGLKTKILYEFLAYAFQLHVQSIATS